MADNQITPFQLTDQFTMDNFNQRINETNTALQNKAPSGFGYGDTQSIVFWDDEDGTKLEQNLDSKFTPDSMRDKVFRAHFVDYPICKVSGNGGFADILANKSNDSNGYPTNIMIVFYAYNMNVIGPSIATKQKINGTWYPWEYVNPPMQLGVEYRTTERYNGKPVYKRAVNIGDITGNGKSTFASNGATTVLSGELLFRGYLPFTYINGPDLNNSWTRYANVDIAGSNIEVSYFIGSSYGTSNNTVVILRYLKD